MALAELQRPVEQKMEQEQCLTQFELGLYEAFELLPHQLENQHRSFKEQVKNIFNRKEFLEEDDYTSRHYLASKITENWPENNMSVATKVHNAQPAESYKSFLLKVLPIIEESNPEIEEENPGRIAYNTIQGLVQTEMGLRDLYNDQHQGDLINLTSGARNTMFFALSDELIRQDTNTREIDLEEGVIQNVQKAA